MQNVTREQVENMGGRELVALYNELCPEKPVRKFASRAAGVRRVLAAMEAAQADTPVEQAAASEAVEAATSPEEEAQPEPGAGPGPSASMRSRKRSSVQRFTPEGELKAPRPTSKRGKLLEWLLEPAGMSEEEIAAMFEWTARDVKDALRLLAKVNGYVVYLGDDERWHAAEPEGDEATTAE